VLTSALKQVVQTLDRETPARGLFASQGGAVVTPPAEIVIALSGILLLGLGVLVGVRLVWQQRWRNPLMVLLVFCAFIYLGTLPLRFVPAAWETVSRAGDFLFIGVGLTVALGLVWMLERGKQRSLRVRLLISAAATIVFASGVIAGWPANERLAQPRVISVPGGTLDPPAVVAAEWSGRTLGPDQRVFAQDADARFFLTNGLQTALTGNFAPDVDDMLNAKKLTPAMRTVLRDYRATLVVSDRREISGDNLFGFYFDSGPPALAPASTASKFNVPRANRLYDSGDLVIYGVRGLW
jgi:hypothetical protein